MRLSHEILTVRTAHPFIIARGGSSEYRVVWVKVTDADGAEGWGEANPSKYYGETPETVTTALGRLASLLEGADPWSLETIEEEMNRAPPSSFTIAIAPTTDELRRRVAEAAAYPVLKVKLGTERDEAIIRAVR